MDYLLAIKTKVQYLFIFLIFSIFDTYCNHLQLINGFLFKNIWQLQKKINKLFLFIFQLINFDFEVKILIIHIIVNLDKKIKE